LLVTGCFALLQLNAQEQPKQPQQQPTTERLPTQRVKVARLSPAVREAIDRGLTYLAKPNVQHEDGSWGGNANPVAETSLTLMAFMLKGHVPGRGKFGEPFGDYMNNVRRWL